MEKQSQPFGGLKVAHCQQQGRNAVARYLQIVAPPLGLFHEIRMAAVGTAMPSASGGGIAADAVIPDGLEASSEHWSGFADSPAANF